MYVRPGTVLPVGAVDATPEYACAEDVTLRAFDLADGADVVVRVPGGTGAGATFTVRREGGALVASSADAPSGWVLEDVASGRRVEASGPGEVRLELPWVNGSAPDVDPDQAAPGVDD